MERNLSREESLEVITRMINTAKNDIQKGDGFLLLLWGYVVSVCSLGHFLLLEFYDPAKAPYIWFLIVVGIGASIWHRIRRKRERPTHTYVDTVVNYLWIGFTVSLITIGFHAAFLNMGAMPVILLFYGLALFATGGAYKFTPLKIGGIICWIGAWVAFAVTIKYQLLVIFFAVVLGYIVPGHLLNRQANVQ